MSTMKTFLKVFFLAVNRILFSKSVQFQVSRGAHFGWKPPTDIRDKASWQPAVMVLMTVRVLLLVHLVRVVVVVHLLVLDRVHPPIGALRVPV